MDSYLIPWRAVVCSIIMTYVVTLILLFCGVSLAGADDPIAVDLQGHVIWLAEAGTAGEARVERTELKDQWGASLGVQAGALHVAFRRSFDLAVAPRSATLHLFAATRYQLFINGVYVRRGPCRFERLEAEYDSIPVTAYLRPGRNVLAILVHRDNPTGRIRSVDPGLAARLDMDGERLLSDPSWRAIRELSFGDAPSVWASIPDHRDATRMPEWTAPEVPDAIWPAAAMVARPGPQAWPVLRARRSTLTREQAIMDVVITPGPLPRDLGLQPVTLALPGVAQAFTVLDIEAAAGAMVVLEARLATGWRFRCSYRCRAGRQTWMLDDTVAMQKVVLTATGGAVRLLAVTVCEIRYPFDIAGSFTCPDAQLNRLWLMMARSAQILSEDAYVDCAERERVEWFECSPPLAQTTRVAMTTATPEGPLASDPALLRGVLWRTALSQRDDGAVKAHTCSERWDKHAIMEDRACDWVQMLREYHEHTGDDAFVRELWPRVTRQIDRWLGKRTARGLVRLEEWADWGNPHRYRVFEGTVLNSFMFAAVRDAAYLAKVADDQAATVTYGRAAEELRTAINRELWDGQAGSIGAGLADLTQKDPKRPPLAAYSGIATDIGLFTANEHAAIYALRWHALTGDGADKTYRWLWERRDAFADRCSEAMIFYHFAHVLYAHDDEAADAWMLAFMRRRWQAQLASALQTSTEALRAPSTVHCYSLYPTYLLSAFVLGVQLDGVVGDQRLVIEPRLADLPSASGTVVTELGLVPVAWTKDLNRGTFRVVVPAGATARLRLPVLPGGRVVLDDRTSEGLRDGRWCEFRLAAGVHAGTWQ